MKRLLSDRGYLKSVDKGFRPNAGKLEDLCCISRLLEQKKNLKAETLKLLKSKN